MKKVFHIFSRHLAVLAIIIATAGCSGSPAPSSLSCIAPEFLKSGDRVALISPSYHTPSENVDTAAMILKEWGLEPVIGPNSDKIHLGKYAGSTEERLADIRWALEDSSIKAIICNRGGYGSISFVNRLPSELLSSHPKWMVGFSDITTLLEMENRSGVMGIHGTMGALMVPSKGKDLSSTLLKDLLFGAVPRYETTPHPLSIPGKATGTLVGGNLCTFSPILGTTADATACKDIILFIEEVGEDFSHLDRMINTLILNGVFDRCKGVILGEFTDCKPNLEYDSAEQMICSYLKDYGIPVLCGFPAGHGDTNLPLVMGAPVTLEVTASGGSITFALEGRQAPIQVASLNDTTLISNNTTLIK